MSGASCNFSRNLIPCIIRNLEYSIFYPFFERSNLRHDQTLKEDVVSVSADSDHKDSD